MPTIRGDIKVSFKHAGSSFALDVSVPGNSTAVIYVPALAHKDAVVRLDGQDVKGEFKDNFIRLQSVGAGAHHIEAIKISD